MILASHPPVTSDVPPAPLLRRLFHVLALPPIFFSLAGPLTEFLLPAPLLFCLEHLPFPPFFSPLSPVPSCCARSHSAFIASSQFSSFWPGRATFSWLLALVVRRRRSDVSLWVASCRSVLGYTHRHTPFGSRLQSHSSDSTLSP